jgi:hypothetical protein
MEKRYIEWDRRYVLMIHMNELFLPLPPGRGGGGFEGGFA